VSAARDPESRGVPGISSRPLKDERDRLMDLDLEQLQDNARRASTLLKAMSNEHRLLVLCQLSQGEKSVGEMEKLIGLSQSALSQHLARLRRDNLVKTRRSAQTIYYSLKGEEASTVISTLYGLYCADGDDGTDAERETETERVGPIRAAGGG
jgi:DNA-binding transcriptional ArsR family regulator